MPLMKQRASFPFTAGQEQGIAPELVEPPVLIRAHNVVYDRMGELTKRRGWRAFTEQTSVSAITLPYGDRLAKRENELVWFGEQHTIWNDVGASPLNRSPLRMYSRVIGETGEDTGTPRTWVPKGRVPRFNVSKLREIVTGVPGALIESVDTAFAGDALSDVGTSGVLCVLWQYDLGDHGDRIDWATVDAATGALIAQGTLTTAAGEIPRLIRVVSLKGSDSLWYFHAFYGDAEFDGTAHLKHHSMPAMRPFAWSSSDEIAVDLSGYDVCVTGPSAVGGVVFDRRMYLVKTYGTTVRCELWRQGVAGALSSSSGASFDEDPGLDVAQGQVHCCCDPNGIHVGVYAAYDGGFNQLVQFDATTGPAGTVAYASKVTIDAAAGTSISLGGQVGWYGTDFDAGGVIVYDNFFVSWSYTGELINTAVKFYPNTGDGGSRRLAAFCTHWSRIFAYRGEPYHIVLKGHSPDAVCCEILSWTREGTEETDLPKPYQAARFAGGEMSLASGFTAREVQLSKGRNSVVASWYYPGRFFTALQVASGTEHRISVYAFSAFEADAQQFSNAEIGGGSYIATGIPWCYDGGQGHEIGFSHRPQHAAGEIVGAGVAGGPPFLAAGTYYIAMTWESVDALGRVTQSAPSKHGPITVAANQVLQVTYRSLGPTSHPSTRAVLWSSNDGGLNYYRSTQVFPNSLSETTDSTVAVDPVVMFPAGAPTLYTDAKILSNAPLTAARFACEWQGRLWLANDDLIWPSREVIPGEDPSFNESMQFRLPAYVTGLASLDDRLAMFCYDRIYWTAGDGPTDTGDGGSFAQPQRVPSDFGCIDARSIVRTEKGVLFQSRRGIELLDRGMNTTLISGGVDRLLRESGYSEVVASSLDPQSQIVRFVVRNPSVDTRLVLCWHVLFDVWTTHDVPRVNATAARSTRAFGVVHALGVNWMAFNDPAGHENSPQSKVGMEWQPNSTLANRYMDGGLPTSGYWYGVAVETANVKLDGLLGFSRVWRAYFETKSMSGHTGLRMGYALDYGSFGVGTVYRYWTTAADIAAGATNSPEHLRYAIHIDQQQCSAIRLVVEERQETGLTPPATADANTYLTLVGFGLEYGQKPGTGRGAEGSKK